MLARSVSRISVLAPAKSRAAAAGAARAAFGTDAPRIVYT